VQKVDPLHLTTRLHFEDLFQRYGTPVSARLFYFVFFFLAWICDILLSFGRAVRRCWL
jgi:hypothetical protein